MADGDPLDPLGRLLELAVYAPIGAVVVARERLPEFAAVGRERVAQRITLARFIGQMVVEQGRRELEKRVAAPVTGPPDAATAPPVAPTSRSRPASNDRRADVTADLTADVTADDTADVSTDAPPSAELPIEEYESLAAGQVVARLAALDPADLEVVEAFERTHRNRRTVLNRIAQLKGAA